MYRLKKKAIEVKEEIKPKVEEPKINIEDMIEDIRLGVEEEALKKYEELCKKIKFEPEILREEKFKQYLLKNKIKVYNYKNVTSFLDKEYGREVIPNENCSRRGWYWIRLLNSDSDRQGRDIFGCVPSGRINKKGAYQKSVPYFVLEIVEDIKQEFPNYIPYISELTSSESIVIVPDPFLMYCFDSSRYVIAHWDEPTFKD